jgi:hypothetical protein
MNINLFKKKPVISVDSLNQLYVSQNEFKELKMLVRQLIKKTNEQNEKRNTIQLPKMSKEINYTFGSSKKEPKIESLLIESMLDIDDHLDVTEQSINSETVESIDNPNMTHQEFEQKSEIIIQDLRKHIQDINQYTYTIHGYLLQQLKDRIDEQDELIHELYNRLEIKNQ